MNDFSTHDGVGLGENAGTDKVNVPKLVRTLGVLDGLGLGREGGPLDEAGQVRYNVAVCHAHDELLDALAGDLRHEFVTLFGDVGALAPDANSLVVAEEALRGWMRGLLSPSGMLLEGLASVVAVASPRPPPLGTRKPAAPTGTYL